jgi:hypothetical protein
MAKTTGPLFSLEAHGTVGKTVTYSNWKGRPYVRRRVIPLNPFETDQVAARNRIRCLGPAQFWAQHTTMVCPTATPTDKIKVKAITPDGFAWNGFLVEKAIGENADTYILAAALWAGFTGGEKTAWDVAAAAVVPAIQPASQGLTGGGGGTALTAGNVFLVYRYALYAMGLVVIPTATPPTYVAA